MIFILALDVAVVSAVRGMWSPCGLSMLSSLNPVSERARGNRYWATAAWYILGATPAARCSAPVAVRWPLCGRSRRRIIGMR